MGQYTQQLTESQQASDWWVSLTREERQRLINKYNNGEFITTSRQQIDIWKKETQLSDREKAMLWWHNLSRGQVNIFMSDHYPDRRASDITGREIETIWRKETASPALSDKLDSVELFELLQLYRIAPMEDQKKVIKRFNDVKNWIRENYIPKP